MTNFATFYFPYFFIIARCMTINYHNFIILRNCAFVEIPVLKIFFFSCRNYWISWMVVYKVTTGWSLHMIFVIKRPRFSEVSQNFVIFTWTLDWYFFVSWINLIQFTYRWILNLLICVCMNILFLRNKMTFYITIRLIY